MDPNETLRLVRDNAHEILERDGIGCEGLSVALARDAQALDDWISDGGKLPDDWDRGGMPFRSD
jgi:hypothetical protein